MDSQVVLNPSQLGSNVTGSSPPSAVFHLLSGSFRSLSLFLLAFSPVHRTLSFVQRISSLGPHQYLAANARDDVVYATSWAESPQLSSWYIERSVEIPWRIVELDSVGITATSSYISCPPPYTHIYSVGGHTGEIHHALPASDELLPNIYELSPDADEFSSNIGELPPGVKKLHGGFGERIDEIFFLSEDELEEADKTRTALRHGSHAIEISSRGHAFIAHLGTNSIWMYSVNRFTGELTYLSDNPIQRSKDSSSSKAGKEGPRHIVVSRDGNVLYSVTEHTNKVDIFTIGDTKLEWVASKSILPPQYENQFNVFRGETVRLAPASPSSPASQYLFATTRGWDSDTASQNGFLAIFPLDADSGKFDESKSTTYWETPSSGGKSNAIELKAKDSVEGEGYGVWIVLADDKPGAGGVWVLEWDSGKPEEVKVVAEWDGKGIEGADNDNEAGMDGGSHAIWLD